MTTKRTLIVQTERGETVSCKVVQIERTCGNIRTWLVLTDVDGWLDGDY